METEKNFQPKPEKLAIVYHGSVSGDIQEFEPRKRFTPSGADVPPRVYATPNPAFAAAHSFPWSSDEGIDVTFKDGQTILVIPEEHRDRLNQPVFIYELSGDNFELTEEEETGETYHSVSGVVPDEVRSFSSVTEAVEHFGGRIKIVSSVTE